MFSLRGMNRPGRGIGEDPEAMAGFELSQTFTVPGKLRSQRDAGLAESRVREAELAARRRELVAEVRTLYAELYRIDRADEALLRAADLLDLASASARARYVTGAGPMSSGSGSMTGPGAGPAGSTGDPAGPGFGSPMDSGSGGAGDFAAPSSGAVAGTGFASLARLQVERIRVDEARSDLEAERISVRARLNALLDRTADTEIRTVDGALALPDSLRPDPGAGADILLEGAVAEAPAVQVGRAGVRAAERRLASSRLARWPDLTAGLEYGYRGGLDPMVSARAGFAIPIWKGRKQDAGARAAEHEAAAARQELRAAELAARAEAEAALARLRAAEVQWRRYREEIEPRLDLAINALQAGYTAGRSEAMDLIDSMRMLVETRSMRAAREAELFQAWARWEALTAGPDGPAATDADRERSPAGREGE